MHTTVLREEYLAQCYSDRFGTVGGQHMTYTESICTLSMFHRAAAMATSVLYTHVHHIITLCVQPFYMTHLANPSHDTSLSIPSVTSVHTVGVNKTIRFSLVAVQCWYCRFGGSVARRFAASAVRCGANAMRYAAVQFGVFWHGTVQ